MSSFRGPVLGRQALLAWVHAEPARAEAWQLAALAAVQQAACARGPAAAWQRAQRLCMHAAHAVARQAGPDAGSHARPGQPCIFYAKRVYKSFSLILRV